MRVRVRAAAVAAAALLGLAFPLALAPEASAKEAYSALVDSASTDVTRVFPAGDAALTELERYIPATEPRGNATPPHLEKGVRPDTRGQITVLWHTAGMPTLTSYAIMPDYAGPGEAWMRYVQFNETQYPPGAKARWQAAPDALMTYLEQIGVYDPSAGAASDGKGDDALAATTAARNADSWQIGWWWVGPGILAGAFIALSLRPTTLGLIPGRAERPRSRVSPSGTGSERVS
ncbi:hypothetical protein H9Y04_32235 [Streptomyces sp. TRM66268-LWL]|uniref:Uncharacterized protein n=1 Tax=Streptomyces polyasparticus TaxID=2767826 RepID=A0ABR7SRJ0_9ACTN|nr:hypothetical protein [Streptomyces polyasparticus]MBC9717207.1 hypothetical protein [Streptomyces polyasparticus]